MKTKKNLISSFIVTIFLCFNLQSEVALGQSPSVIIDSVYNFVFPAYHVFGAVNWVIGETCSDLAEVGGDSFSGDFTRDRPEYQQLSLFNISDDNIAIENYYMWNYYGIGWCNLALYKLKLQGIPDPNNKLKTEAITLRALMYFNLVKIFGGVSIYTQNDLKSDSLFNSKFNLDYLAEKSKGWSYVHNIFDYDTIIPRSTASDVYSFIENDLDSVFLYLPSKSSLSLSEKNHVTKGMALALLTNINIYQNQWQKALDYSEQLINSGDYALLSHFSDVFSVSNEHGSESIFEI